MGSAKRASTRSVGIALISQVACLTTFILGATPCLATPAIHWLDAPPPDHEPKRIPPAAKQPREPRTTPRRKQHHNGRHKHPSAGFGAAREGGHRAKTPL
jgi:hypothetical protein